MFGGLKDTILAVSSPPGRGAVSILRLSGPEALERVRRLSVDGLETVPSGGGRVLGTTLRLLGCSVRVVVRVDRAPRSYTREDMVEILLPGSPPLVRLVAQALLGAEAGGAETSGGTLRWARAGEFTLRAFLNGRIDLSQAEAVASLIGAGGEAEARASRRALRGELGAKCRELRDSLIELIALVEAGLDFPDEDLPETSTDALRVMTESLGDGGRALLLSGAIRVPRPGTIRVAIAGFPNAGKSSLLNALLGREAAITSALPGTTRDPIRGCTLRGDRLIEWIDLAGTWSAEWLCMGVAHGISGEGGPERGLPRRAERGGVPAARGPGTDLFTGPLVQILRRLTWLEIESSDLVLWVVDAHAPQEDSLCQYAALPVPRKLLVFQKLDLVSRREAKRLEGRSDRPVCVSARERRGLAVLLDRVLAELGGSSGPPGRGLPSQDPQFLVSAYEEAALRVAEEAVRRAEQAFEAGSELAVADLRDALGALEELIGATPREAILNSIFSRFCIGK